MKRTVLCAMALMGVGSLMAEDAYIESDGTQFINTGYYVKPTSRVELDFAFVNFADTAAYVQTRVLDNNASVETPSLAASVYVGGTVGTSNYSLAGCIGDCGSFSGVWTSNSGTGTKSAYCDSTKRTIVLDELNKRIAIEANGAEVWYNDQSSARIQQYRIVAAGVVWTYYDGRNR